MIIDLDYQAIVSPAQDHGASLDHHRRWQGPRLRNEFCGGFVADPHRPEIPIVREFSGGASCHMPHARDLSATIGRMP